MSIIQSSSYPLTNRSNLVVSQPSFYDVHYVQVYINLWNVKAKESVLDIPVGPPLPRTFQIFQLRSTCESTESEFSLHTAPYKKCKATDWIFRCHLNANDEMNQETWLIKPDDRVVTPHLYFSFKELAGANPGLVRLEMRICD